MAAGKDYFDIFCEVSQAFASAQTQNELLNLIVKSAVETMDGKAACLFLRDKVQNFFIPVAQTGLSENYLHASPMTASLLMDALETEGHLYFENATTDPRLENHEAKKAEGIATLITVPVRVFNDTRGILSFYSGKPRKFNQKEIDFLSALADQGGIAIHTNSLLERIRKNSMLFLELASNINSSLDIKEILSNLTENICDTLDMKGADIRLIDEDSDELALVASFGLSQEFLDIKTRIDTATTVRALKGETVIVSDEDSGIRDAFKEAMLKEGIKSMIVIPILARENVIGIMRLYNEIQATFPSDTLVVMEALAHQGGLAIQNASMFLKLSEEKANLEEDIWSHRTWF